MPAFRQERVRQLLHQEITMLFLREVSDPRLAGVTVTRVGVSPDLRYARIFVAPQATEEESNEMMAGIRHASGYIRRRMAQALDLRFAPEIRFDLDRAIEKAERFLQVLAHVEAEERAAKETPRKERKPAKKTSARKKIVKRKKQ